MTSADRDLLLSRVVDRLAEPQDWEALMAAAEDEPTLWRELALCLRDDDLLRLSLDAELAGVPAVEAPAPAVQRWAIGWRALSGWAAALLFALAWWLDRTPVPATDQGPRGAPSLARPAEGPGSVVVPAEAAPGPRAAPGLEALPVADARRPGGLVVGEVGRELLETRPSPDGQGVEVLYLRQELVREVVDQVFELGLDELGQPRPVPVPAARLAASEVL